MNKQVLTRPGEIKKIIPLTEDRQLELSRPLIMGILNVTPDSFSDGNDFSDITKAVDYALKMESEGADIIDIGGESTRPGAEPVEPEEEAARVVPVIEAISRQSTIPISIDTYRSSTAREAIDAGADIINDISALRVDPEMATLVASRKVPVILMHMQEDPRNMQKNPHYENCVDEITQFFEEQIEYATISGIDRSKIILDPGIGFGKRLSDNLEIITKLNHFTQFSMPLLIGISRKSFIGMINPVDSHPRERLGGSLAAMVAAVANGANIVRVHDIAPTVEALKVLQALRETV